MEVNRTDPSPRSKDSLEQGITLPGAIAKNFRQF
jgi:hypothetical protein